MAKASPLMQGLDRKRAKKKKAAADAEAAPVPAYRIGRVLVAGHFDPAVQKALKYLAVDNDTTVQALLTEAINMLFAAHGKPEIAGPPAPAPVEEVTQ